MNSFSDLIIKRRSTRKFTGEALSQDQVVALLKAALMSPSSKRNNSWQFIAIEDKELLKALAGCKEQGVAFMVDAALAVVVLADPSVSDVWIEDASIASVIMQLQAEDLGLGSCWVQIRERQTASEEPASEYIRRLLNIPLPLQVLSVIAVGHKAAERKPFNEEFLQWEKIHINKFGEK
ncbi:FMN reductase (NADPH) [termite gut metagenome]|uniref:FMN reductase (NADPH) n=1 Tax=termite gut metagenome TaxID=433724 RepID=A0A5J4S953_9ZZZZ